MSRYLVLLTLCVSAVFAVAGDRVLPATTAVDRVLDKVVAREAEFNKSFRAYTPLVETYLQVVSPDKQVGFVPTEDHYFLGRLGITKDQVSDHTFVDAISTEGGFLHRLLSSLKTVRKRSTKTAVSLRGAVDFSPTGFAEMAFVDRNGFDRAHYDFRLIRREFLGEVRCLLFDVEPKSHAGNGRFRGRIWVEDQDYNIVRFNGTYVAAGWHIPSSWHYMHFDSWRANMISGQWLPSYIYSEESNLPLGALKHETIRAQTRLWGYNVGGNKWNAAGGQDVLTQVFSDPADRVKDQSGSGEDLSPLGARRAWEGMAEGNVLERMERAGFLAPRGAVDKVLETVVNNLLATNNLQVDPDIHCRVLLTAPLESFTIGQTIVVSRGLLDVLPDEASLAAVLAHELANLALGHILDTKWAFSDRIFFEDSTLFAHLQMARTPEEEKEADAKSLEILKRSPYGYKLAAVGLFMRQFNERRPVLPNLCRARLGNGLVLPDKDPRLSTLLSTAPNLEQGKLDQIAAMPLGTRIRVNPWSNEVQLSQSRTLALYSPRDKMPFEITPVYPYLFRLSNAEAAPAPQSTSEPRPSPTINTPPSL